MIMIIYEYRNDKKIQCIQEKNKLKIKHVYNSILQGRYKNKIIYKHRELRWCRLAGAVRVEQNQIGLTSFNREKECPQR